jgi:hypothetical protein
MIGCAYAQTAKPVLPAVMPEAEDSDADVCTKGRLCSGKI